MQYLQYRQMGKKQATMPGPDSGRETRIRGRAVKYESRAIAGEIDWHNRRKTTFWIFGAVMRFLLPLELCSAMERRLEDEGVVHGIIDSHIELISKTLSEGRFRSPTEPPPSYTRKW
jgi:hypothetical protein